MGTLHAAVELDISNLEFTVPDVQPYTCLKVNYNGFSGYSKVIESNAMLGEFLRSIDLKQEDHENRNNNAPR